MDPNGRKYDLLTQISQDYTNPSAMGTEMVHTGSTLYDNWDRVTAQYEPILKTGAGVNFNPTSNPLTDPKTEQQYENNQRSRAMRIASCGENILTGHTFNANYNLITGVQLANELSLNTTEKGLLMPGSMSLYSFLKTAVMDEDNKKIVSYTDAFKRTVATNTFTKTQSKIVW